MSWLAEDFAHSSCKWRAIVVRKYGAATFRFEKGKPCGCFGENEERHLSCPSIACAVVGFTILVVVESFDEFLSF